MPAVSVYHEVRRLLQAHVTAKVDEASLERLSLLVVGILKAEHAAPARIAQALHTLGLSDAKAESIERRIRRIENDTSLRAATCVHPLAQQRLRFGQPSELVLVLDPTTQDERVVMLTAAVWYRGRALPLAWAVWPANTPLVGQGFWDRVAALLAEVAPLLPVGVSVTWLADRAFGTPAFTDVVTAYGWHYVVRVQDQTRYRDRAGRESAIRHLVRCRSQRLKGRGQVFKKHGFRQASVVVYWGRAYTAPLCLVSDRRPSWYLLHLYRQRSAIETLFRHDKRHGWQWETGQVTDLTHLARLLVGMALASWVALLVGTQVAQDLLAAPPTGTRHTRPYAAKFSLWRLGLQRLQRAFVSDAPFYLPWRLEGWEAPNWEDELTWHHARAFVLHAVWLAEGEDC